MEEAPSAASDGAGGAGAAPPPQTTAPASWRLTLPWLGITWGGLVDGRGHRKGQMRVLGSPSALRTKKPRTGRPPGGQGVREPEKKCKSPLIHIPEGTETGLWAPRPSGVALVTSSYYVWPCPLVFGHWPVDHQVMDQHALSGLVFANMRQDMCSRRG
jgi:hypothetical protein